MKESLDKFLEIYGVLPRAGPGANVFTRKAFQMMRDVPSSPKMLDVGCGPGMQTIELLRLSAGTVVGLDLLPQMLVRLRATAEIAGVSDRLLTVEGDMHEMAFSASSFDIIWSEGAIYLLGFEAGLRPFKRLVKPGGYVVVSDVVWLKPNPPLEVIEFWEDYPDITSVEEKLGIVKRVGLEVAGHFILPSTAWTEYYYDPMEIRIAEKAKEWKGDSAGEAVLKEARHEIEIFRKYSEFYSYAFFVMRKTQSV